MLNRRLFSSIFKIIFIIILSASFAVAGELQSSFVGKIVFSKEKLFTKDNTQYREFVFRVRGLNNDALKTSGRLQILLCTVETNTELETSLLKIHEKKKYGIFEVFQVGRRWTIVDAKYAGVYHQNIETNEAAITAKDDEALVIEDPLGESTINNSSTVINSVLFGNSGISIGE